MSDIDESMWEYVIDALEANPTRPAVRRLRVPNGWLYQVADTVHPPMWHPPLFVPGTIKTFEVDQIA